MPLENNCVFASATTYKFKIASLSQTRNAVQRHRELYKVGPAENQSLPVGNTVWSACTAKMATSETKGKQKRKIVL